MQTDPIIPTATDRASRPERLRCPCGLEWSWTWWEPPPRWVGIHHGRWCPPHVDPCERCSAARETRSLERRISDRLRAAGVPARHAERDLEALVWRRPDEHAIDHHRRVAAAGPRAVGIDPSDAELVGLLASWTPAHGSVYVAGPVGTGKTTLACALTRRLLSPEPLRRVHWLEVWHTLDAATQSLITARLATDDEVTAAAELLGRDYVYLGGGTVDVEYAHEADAIERQRLAWAGDRVPMLRLAECEVLVLDDLGLCVDADSGRAPRVPLECIQRLVGKRYREDRPMILTSNLPWSRIAGIDGERPMFGARVADRLAEMVGPNTYTLSGESWRA